MPRRPFTMACYIFLIMQVEPIVADGILHPTKVVVVVHCNSILRTYSTI